MKTLARIPLRARMTLAFVVTTGVVFLALSLFLHGRLRDELGASLRDALRSRAGDLAGQVERTGEPGLPVNALVERGDDLAQVLDVQGRIRSAAPGVSKTPLLTPTQAGRASHGVLVLDRGSLEDDDDDVMLLAAPAGRFVAVVGADLNGRNDALESLDGLLAVGMPVALLLAGAAGFVVAGVGLRPVERIRQRAEAIGVGDLGQRVPEPSANDELGRLARTLNGMLSRLQDGFARERQFVGDASHELRTPLARLRAELELASADGRSPEQLREAVQSSAAEVELLARLADDLLVLARADQGKLPVRAEPLRLGPFLQEAAARFDIPPVAVACAADVVVDADPIRLRQALGNLLDNAGRHADGATRIAVDPPSAGQVRIHVLDAGAGIPTERRAEAFERFTRGDTARTGDGAGLGLSIVAAVAAAHGGQAGIADAPGGGADVWLSVPFSLRSGGRP